MVSLGRPTFFHGFSQRHTEVPDAAGDTPIALAVRKKNR